MYALIGGLEHLGHNERVSPECHANPGKATAMSTQIPGARVAPQFAAKARVQQVQDGIIDALTKAEDGAQKSAQTILTTLRGKLDGNGRARTGYLKLINATHADRDLAFETKGSWRMKLTADRNKETAAALKTLFQQAGYDTQALDAYLDARKAQGKFRLQNSEVLKLLNTAQSPKQELLPSWAPENRASQSLASSAQILFKDAPPEPPIPDSSTFVAWSPQALIAEAQNRLAQSPNSIGLQRVLQGLKEPPESAVKAPQAQASADSQVLQALPLDAVLTRENLPAFYAIKESDELIKWDGMEELLLETAKTLETTPEEFLCSLGTVENALRFLEDSRNALLSKHIHDLDALVESSAPATVEDLLSHAGLQLKYVPDDGHCMFHALAYVEGEASRQAWSSNPLEGQRAQRQALLDHLGTLTASDLEKLEDIDKAWGHETALASTFSILVQGLEPSHAEGPAWGTAAELALKAIQSQRPVVSLTAGQVKVYHPNGSSEVLSNATTDAFSQKMADLRAGGAPEPLVLYSKGTHWWATEPIPYLNVITTALVDGIPRPVKFGGTPPDGNCGLHAMNRALGLQWTRKDFVQAVRAQGPIEHAQDRRLAMILDDLIGAHQQVDSKAFLTQPDKWIGQWETLFTASDGTAPWVGQSHIEWMAAMQQRTVEVWVPGLDPSQLVKSNALAQDGAQVVTLVNTDTNPQRGESHRNEWLKDQGIVGVDMARIRALQALNPEARRQAILGKEPTLFEYLKNVWNNGGQGYDEEEIDWNLEPNEDIHSAEEPVKEVPEGMDLEREFQDLIQSLFMVQTLAAHWDTVEFGA